MFFYTENHREKSTENHGGVEKYDKSVFTRRMRLIQRSPLYSVVLRVKKHNPGGALNSYIIF